MGSLFPRYAKSVDPDVVTAVLTNGRRYARFLDAATELSLRYTGAADRAWIEGHALKGATVVALDTTGIDIDDLPGRWRKTGSGEFDLLPVSANPVRDDFEDATFRPTAIPDRPTYMRGMAGEVRLGGTGMVVVIGDTVFSGYGFDPDEVVSGQGNGSGCWQEVSAKAFEEARERVDTRVSQTRQGLLEAR